LVDDLTAEVELMVWQSDRRKTLRVRSLRHLVGILLILPELERSGDLAEHIAQRAVTNLGAQMSPSAEALCSGWPKSPWRCGVTPPMPTRIDLRSQCPWHEDDEEIDILHDRLIGEIAAETMPTAIGAQVTLLARFYERLGDHAVNLARRIEMLHPIKRFGLNLPYQASTAGRNRSGSPGMLPGPASEIQKSQIKYPPSAQHQRRWL
jgi:phosphate transport system protein